MPSDASLIGKIGTVFRNIERSEVLGGIYLVCRVYPFDYVLETSQLGKDNKKRHGMFSRSSHNGSNVNAQPHRRPYGVACFDLSSNISKLENIDWSSLSRSTPLAPKMPLKPGSPHCTSTLLTTSLKTSRSLLDAVVLL